ncbi:unnamed protein product, partial [Linum tenue]
AAAKSWQIPSEVTSDHHFAELAQVGAKILLFAERGARRLNETKREALEASSSAAQLKLDLENATARREQFAKECEEAQMTATMELSRLQGALDEERNNLATLQAEKDALAQEAGAQASEIDILKEEKRRLKDAHKESEKSLKRARKEISELRQSLDNLMESET